MSDSAPSTPIKGYPPGQDVVGGRGDDSTRVASLEMFNSDPAMFELILESNGWSKEEFLNQRENFTYLEMFLLNIPRLPQVQYFTRLTTLRLMHIGLVEIGPAFSQLKHLEKLWLQENKITVISGLEGCIQLRELYLHMNGIQRTTGLETLVNLEVLWVGGNQISKIEGLQTLKKLKTFWAPGNKLTSLDGFFSSMPDLENINLAGNAIASFREIPPLSMLPNLAKLYFSDPTFGDNPICTLCNYQIFTLYHLPRVTTLDYMTVGPDQRSLAVATFTKKTMYYQMRMKTLKRNTNQLLAAAQNIFHQKKDEQQLPIDTLQRMRLELQRELFEYEEFAPLIGTSTELATRQAAIKKKLTSIENLLQDKLRQVALVEQGMRTCCEDMKRASDAQTLRLLLELNTGGNVRIEDGRQKDVWYQSCVDLLKTRFFAPEFDPFGIKGINVSKVSRLYNRSLRSRFDAALEELVDLSDPSYKRALEYLFFVDINGTYVEASSLFSLVEHGFSPEAFQNGVPLTNSVFLSDQNRLIRSFKAGELSGRTQTTRTLQAQILVVKVFLGKCAAEKQQGSSPAVQLGTSTSQASALAEKNLLPVATDLSIDRNSYPPNTLSVYRAKSTDSRQRVWYCLDPNLILPEYIIDIAYTAGPLLTPAPLAEWHDGKQDELISHIQRFFPSCTNRVDINDHLLGAPYFMGFTKSADRLTADSGSSKASEVLISEPNLAPRPPLSDVKDSTSWHTAVLGSEVASRLSAAPEAGFQFTRLDVSNRKVASFSQLFGESTVSVAFQNLKSLTMAFNDISKVDVRLSDLCPKLELLDLSNNNIKRLDGALRGLGLLKSLRLDQNLLYRLEDLTGLSELSQLSDLSIRSNPVTATKRFSAFVASHLKSLKMLNGEVVAEALRGPTIVNKALLVYAAKMSATKGATDSLANQTPSSYADFPADAIANDDSSSLSPAEEGTLARCELLSLSGLILEKMNHSAWLRGLIRLDLSDNYITRLDGLGALTALLELSLENNLLRSLEGLGSLTQLKKLELGKNKITSLQGIESFSQLVFLSLEENEIESITLLAQLPCLMEAYFARNQVKNGKEVNQLRELPKLIIMDLSGNPCCQEDGYRLYSIFQLKKLKVLDGVSVDPEEAAKARDTFAGRINTELLNERVGEGVPWSEAKELSLASCALKEVTMMESFKNLMHLKLDHNNLVDISGLRRCTALVSLNLAHNKLGTTALGRILDALPRLESISLEANGVQSIAALQLRLPVLKFLNLKGNDITKVDGLEGLGELRELMIDKNKLRSIDRDCFVANPRLKELYAEENSIKTIEGVKTLTGLLKLSLAVNRISEIPDIERGIGGHSQMVEVCFLGNAVVRKPMYRTHLIHMLPACLVIDNREVTMEERERSEQLFQQETAIPPNVFTDVRSPVTGGGPIAVQSMPSPPFAQLKPNVVNSAGAGIRFVTIDGIANDPNSPASLGGPRRTPSSGIPSSGRPVRTSSADYSGGVRPRVAKQTSAVMPMRKR